MDSLASINWPTTEVITGVVREFQTDPATFRGAGLLPMNASSFNQNPKTIEWDILGAAMGMTQAHQLDTDPKPVKFPVLKTKKVDTSYWKELGRLDESDLLNIRKAGTLAERMARGLIMKRLEQMNIRCDTRVEYLRWQAILGSLAISEGGVIRTIDYEVPGDHKVTPDNGDWDVLDASDPIADLQTWCALFDGTGAGNPVGWFGRTVAGYLAKNEVVRDLVRQSSAVQQIGLKNVGDLVSTLVGDMAGLNLYPGGYLNDSGTWTPFVPDNKIILIGQGPAGEKFGEFASTPSLHNGGIDGATGGKFGFIEDNSGKPNPHVNVVGGIYGLPVIYHPSWIIIATVTGND